MAWPRDVAQSCEFLCEKIDGISSTHAKTIRDNSQNWGNADQFKKLFSKDKESRIPALKGINYQSTIDNLLVESAMELEYEPRVKTKYPAGQALRHAFLDLRERLVPTQTDLYTSSLSQLQVAIEIDQEIDRDLGAEREERTKVRAFARVLIFYICMAQHPNFQDFDPLGHIPRPRNTKFEAPSIGCFLGAVIDLPICIAASVGIVSGGAASLLSLAIGGLYIDSKEALHRKNNPHYPTYENSMGVQDNKFRPPNHAFVPLSVEA